MIKFHDQNHTSCPFEEGPRKELCRESFLQEWIQAGDPFLITGNIRNKNIFKKGRVNPDCIEEIHILDPATGTMVSKEDLNKDLFEEYNPSIPEYIPTRMFIPKANVEDQ